MANKKKKKKKKNCKPCPNYGQLLTTLSTKDFLAFIFHTDTIRRYVSHWNLNYDSVAIRLSKLKDYLHDDDLHKYFMINHTFNFNETNENYEGSIFKLLTNLCSDLPSEVFVERTEESIANPEYVYAYDAILDLTPALVSFARDYLYYGFDYDELKVMYGLRYEYLIEKFKEIYQLELLPIDISLQSYY